MARGDDAGDFLKPPAVVKSGKRLHATGNRAFQGIPSLAIAPGGRLWATWYAGVTPAEDENNYVVLSTSGDGGATWTEVLIVDPDEDGPVRAYDPELWMAPDGKLRLAWAQAVGHEGTVAGVWFLTISNPSEAAPQYAPPRRITDGIMMCKPLVTEAGQWLLPASTWRKTDNSARVVASDDQGKTWTVLGGCNVPVEVRNFDEHMLIQRNDGHLWMLVRTTYGIGQSVSTDGGRTWPELSPSKIEHTTARFFIRRLQSGNLLLVKHGPIDKRIGRSHLTAYVSKDDGRTWSGGLLLDERNRVSYPDGQQAADGTIRIIYDFDRTGERHILMATFQRRRCCCRQDRQRCRQIAATSQRRLWWTGKKEMSRRLLPLGLLGGMCCDSRMRSQSAVACSPNHADLSLVGRWRNRPCVAANCRSTGSRAGRARQCGQCDWRRWRYRTHTRRAMARPDGYTLLMATVELNMLHWRGVCPITPESYRPLARLNEDSAAVFVRSDAQWQSVVDLEERVSLCRQPDSGVRFGSRQYLALGVGRLVDESRSTGRVGQLDFDQRVGTVAAGTDGGRGGSRLLFDSRSRRAVGIW